MHRFFVIEAKRLLPLLFLLVLLVSLSIYDNFFREFPVAAPDEDLKNTVAFVTADQGELGAPASFEVIASAESWAGLLQERASLPDYPFNPAYEYAVSAVNGEIKSVQVYPQEGGAVQVQVKIGERPHSYHLVTLEREKVGEKTHWLFLDDRDQILHEITLPGEEQSDPGDAVMEETPGDEEASADD